MRPTEYEFDYDVEINERSLNVEGKLTYTADHGSVGSYYEPSYAPSVDVITVTIDKITPNDDDPLGELTMGQMWEVEKQITAYFERWWLEDRGEE